MRKQVDIVNHVGSAPASAPSAPPAGPADAVLELVHTVMHQFRSLQYHALRDAPHGLTHMDSKVMGFFAHHPGATLSDLAQHSGRDKAQLARLVKGLRERGLLQGEADAVDRRNLRLTLTEPGHAVLRQLQQQMQRVGEHALAGFNAAEQQQLLALLQRLQQNLDAPEH